MADKVELLAPAGTWDVLEKVVTAGADAVYLGGKKFNMRLLKGDYNFTNEEIYSAAGFLHNQNKKLYITLNNLFFENEIHAIKDYLLFLAEVGVDGLIIQDLGVVDICREIGLNLPLHASVQMGIGNSEAVSFLQQQGLSRVILSKNLTLEEITTISQTTTMGIEIFTHGDLCISHTGQCYMSSFIGGASGNRGRCIKPCRFPYKLGSNGDEGYYLSHNDLSLYPLLPQLIKAGVCSFKIEGRMRSAEYLAAIINVYRQTIDNIQHDKDDYQIKAEQLKQIESIRVRNLTTAGIVDGLGDDIVDITGAREPKIPTKPRKLKVLLNGDSDKEIVRQYPQAKLAVKIGNLSAINAIKENCDTIIAGLEQFIDEKRGFDLNAIIELLENIKDTDIEVKIETPRIVTQKNWANITKLAIVNKYNNFKGIIVNDLGSLLYFSKAEISVWGGPNLNITNKQAYKLLADIGLLGLCFSPELKMDNLKAIDKLPENGEIIIHGSLDSLITDYPILERHTNDERCLADEYGQEYKLRLDKEGRTHIYYPYDLCLYRYLPDLLDMGITRLRIDGHFYEDDVLARIVEIYQEKLHTMSSNLPSHNRLDELLSLSAGKLSHLSFSKANI